MKQLKSLIAMIGIFAILFTVTACDLNPPSDPNPPSGENLAKGCTVTVSSAETGNPKEYLVDGDLTTQWSSTGDQADFTVDLGGVKQISKIELHPSYDLTGASDGPISYTLYSGNDGINWTKVIDSPVYTVAGDASKCAPLVLDGLSVSCRYLKVSTIDWPGWVAAYEFEVYK